MNCVVAPSCINSVNENSRYPIWHWGYHNNPTTPRGGGDKSCTIRIDWWSPTTNQSNTNSYQEDFGDFDFYLDDWWWVRWWAASFLLANVLNRLRTIATDDNQRQLGRKQNKKKVVHLSSHAHTHTHLRLPAQVRSHRGRPREHARNSTPTTTRRKTLSLFFIFHTQTHHTHTHRHHTLYSGSCCWIMILFFFN